MDDVRGIVSFQVSEYGHVRVKLAQIMDKRGITRNGLRKLTGIKYDMIDRYYKAEGIQRVDLDFIAKVCFVLHCRVEDILEYEPPGQENK